MSKLFNNHYELISEIDDMEGLYLVKDKNTSIEYIVKQILQDTTENENQIILKEFQLLANQTLPELLKDSQGRLKDFFIEDEIKYLVVEFSDKDKSIEWLNKFPSLGYIFENSYIVIHGFQYDEAGPLYFIREAEQDKYLFLREIYDSANYEGLARTFRKEGEQLLTFKHQSLPEIINLFTYGHTYYLVMEYINGRILKLLIEELKEDEVIPEMDILNWSVDLCDLFENIHLKQLPLLFNKLNPENIIITGDKKIKLMNFGISCICQHREHPFSILSDEGYVYRDNPPVVLDIRIHIHSLGNLINYILTGVQSRNLPSDFPPPYQFNSDISRDISLVVLKSFHQKLKDRYQSISEMKNDLIRIIQKYINLEQEKELISRGENFEEEKDFNNAISQYAKILNINHHSEVAFHNIGRCYENMGITDKALEAYHKAMDVSISSDIKKKCNEKIKFLQRENLVKSFGLNKALMIEEMDLIPVGKLEYGSYLTVSDFRLVTGAGHTSGISSVSFVPDSNLIISGSKDKFIKLWDMEQQLLLGTLEGHIDSVNAMSLSSDGNLLASASKDRTVKLWDLRNKSLSYVIGCYREEVRDVSFSPDMKKLVSASGNQIYMWDVEFRSLIYIFQGHEDKVNTVIFSNDSNLIFSGSSDKTIKVWDSNRRKLIYTFDGFKESVRLVSISCDNKLLAVNNGHVIDLYDTDTRNKLTTFYGYGGKIGALSFSPSGKLLACGGSDRNINILDIEKEETVFTLTGHTGWIEAIRWDREGNRLLSGSSDNTIRLWDMDNGNLKYTFGGHYNSVEAIALSPDGKILASGNGDNTIKLWNTDNKTLISVLQGHKGVVSDISYNIDGVLASGSWDEMVYIWNGDTVKCSIEPECGLVGAIAFCPDGKILATGGSDNTIKLWDLQSGKLLKQFEGTDWSIEAVAFSPDGRWIASGWSDNNIIIWEVKTGQELICLKGHSNSITSIAFGYRDNILVSGSKDNTVKIWEFTKKTGPGTLTKNLVHTFKGHTASISSVCFSKDGSFLASAGKDNTINVYDMNSLRLLFTLTGHTSAITSIVFSQDSKSIFSGSNDGTIKEWDLSRKCLSHTMVAINKEGIFEYISYSPDNRYNCSPGGKEYLFFERIKKK